MNRAIRRVAVLFALCFVALAANLAYLQVIRADWIVGHERNTRNIERELASKRGSIISADGRILAQSVKTGRYYARRYPLGATTGQVTGFYSIKYGRTGLEASYQNQLTAKHTYATARDALNDLMGTRPPGNDLVLTLDVPLQRAAIRALGDRRGAIVALDPTTGAVRALVSYPRYNPSQIEKRFRTLSRDKSSPLLNRATQGLYPPGSTFKIVTAATALANGTTALDKVYEGPSVLRVYGGKVTNFEDEEFGTMPFSRAFAVSCNTIFAQVGLELGDEKLVGGAQDFGFNRWVPFDVPTYASRIERPEDKLDLAWTAVGQSRTLATPLQMALVVAAVANGGTINEPYLVDEIRDYRGTVVRKASPRAWQRPINAATATKMKELMVEVVEDGTGRRAQIDGVTVAGKTGTAEPSDKKRTHAWFVGFAPAEQPRVVVAVIVEHGGVGGRDAGPLARDVMEAALR